MKVKKLIKLLLEYDMELDVVMSKDGEGNRFYKVSNVEGGKFDGEESFTPYEGEDIALIPKKKWNAVCIWPIG